MNQSTIEIWTAALNDAQKALNSLMQDSALLQNCENFSRLLADTFRDEKNLLVCGNGGSHCDSMHFAEELTGRFRKNRRPLGAIALGDPTHLTCVSNDFGFEYIFSRQVEGIGKAGDLLVVISTSGNSKNVILAVEAAKKKKMKTVALLGKDGGQLKSMVDIPLIVPAQSPDRIQELHIKIIHTVVESVERKLFPENY